MYLQISLLPMQINLSPLEYIRIDDRIHRVGLFVSTAQAEIPIATAYKPGSDVVISMEKASGPYVRNSVYGFDGLTFPYEFRIEFCPERGLCPNYIMVLILARG